MGIRIYKKNEHPAGFVGIRVNHSSSTLGYRQRYFNFRNRDKTLKTKQEQADLLEQAKTLYAKWYSESQKDIRKRKLENKFWLDEKCRYSKFTLRLAVGLLIQAKKTRFDKSTFSLYYTVSNSKDRPRLFHFNIRNSDAWQKALDKFANIHKLTKEEMKMISKPSAQKITAFKKKLKQEGIKLSGKL